MAIKADYVARETATNLVRNFTLTIASILTVAVSLSLVGMALLFSQGVDNATRQWEGGVEFIVYMQPDAGTEQISSVEAELTSNPQVREFRWVDQDESYEEAERLFASTPELLDAVSPEILPPSFRVVPTDSDPEIIEGLTAVFEDRPGVREVVAAIETIRTIENLANLVRWVLLGIAAFLLLAALLLILNSIRMAMFARRREIEVMKLVGASNWFIRVPFMLEGVVQGLVGSGLALVSVFLVRRGLDSVATNPRYRLFGGLAVDSDQVFNTSIFLLIVGVVIGAIGSAVAIRRFLDV